MVPKKIQQILTRRREISTLCYSEIESSDGWRLRLVRKLHADILKKAPIADSVLLSLLPGKLTSESIDIFSNKLAGTLTWLSKGTILGTWTGEEAWHTVQCMDVFPVFKKLKVPFSVVNLDVLDGQASGQVPSLILPEWKLSQLTAKALKKVRKAKPYPYDIAGMYFGAILSLDERRRFRIEDIDVTNQERDWNRELMSARTSGCIQKMFKRCDYCAFGRSECSSAYHSIFFARGACSQCHHTQRYITPQGICWECIRNDNLPDIENRKESCTVEDFDDLV